ILANDRPNQRQILIQAGAVRSIFRAWLKRNGTLRFLQSRVLVPEHSIGLRETCRGEIVVWLIFAERLQRIAGLFCRNFCARAVSSLVLGESQKHSKSAFFQLSTKVVLGDSRL